MPVAPRIVNDVSSVTRINHESHFLWQVGLEGESCCSAHCNDFWYVMRINDASHFSWQAQYLVTLVDDTCCFAHCK